MSSTGERVGLGIGRGILDVFTLGMAEIGFRGQRYTHDVIEAKISCKTHGTQYYTLELVGYKALCQGYYGCYSPIDGVGEYTPRKYMTLDDLRYIKDNYGSGNCKDHANTWWNKIKDWY